ncbi:hypothetical protein RHMOL_Rhmol02G0154100 [Rhododendron molle]|uniref:Uncharacterized protein n=1 Tax=Rhododendron molle TaxID=49168 RepID=A0ACC0PQU3_RHOML|nr:hypothetical protein RHMOL_Rhmol02G0154100 [Rhododendron molle]
MAHWVLPKVQPVDHSPLGPALYFLDKITPRMKKETKDGDIEYRSRERGDTKEGEIRKTIKKTIKGDDQENTIKGDDQEKTIKGSLLVDWKHNAPV